MGWSGLANNQGVSFTDAQGSGLTQKSTLPTSNQLMTRSDVINYLAVDGTNAAIILNTYNYNSYALPLSGGTLTGNVSVTGNNKITFGPNTTWSQYLQVGGNGIDGSYAQVAASNGNLHLESLGAGYDTYINYYRGGSVRITNASSNLYLGGTFYDNANTAYLLKPSGTSQMYQLYLNAGTKGLVLNNGTSNSISFGTAGVAAPTFTSYSAGVKIILWDDISSTSTGYTIGINSNTMFFTTDTTSSGYAWYAGTTSIATLSGAGAATFSSSVTATTATLNSLNSGSSTNSIVTVDSSGNLHKRDIYASGTYTPTITAVTNVASTTSSTCQYVRIEDVVTVSGRVGITATATGSIATVSFSLPVMIGNFTTSYQAAGSGGEIANNVFYGLTISSNASGNTVAMSYVPQSTFEDYFYFSFTYKIQS